MSTHLVNTYKGSMHAKALEDALDMLKSGVIKEPPETLRNIPEAAETWRKLIELYMQADGTLSSALDLDAVVSYCLAERNLQSLYALSDGLKVLWEKDTKLLQNFNSKTDRIEDLLQTAQHADALIGMIESIDQRIKEKTRSIDQLSGDMVLISCEMPAPKNDHDQSRGAGDNNE